MTPYYEHGGIVIYNADCRDAMEQLAPSWGERPFDLLLTDPPYGINAAGRGTIGSSKNAPVTDYGAADWDKQTAPQELAMARSICRWQIIFGGNYYDLPKTRCWLFWDKDNTGDFADGELAWTNLDKAVRRLVYRWNGMLQQPGRQKESRQHPTQKPEPVMIWALTQAPADARFVFDPFMGSGTTLVAAKRMGRRAIGIEREERYCEIAAKRLSQEALPLEVA